MTATTAPTPPGTLHRLKLTQPVRFYCWPALLLLAVVVIVPAVAVGAWLALVVEVPALGIMAAAVEAARRSTVTPLEVARAALRRG